MKYISKMAKTSFLLAVSAVMILSSCNKDLEQIAGPVVPPVTGISLGATLAANADDSLYMVLVKRAGLLSTINNTALTYTMFVPGNDGMRKFVTAASGGQVPAGAPDAVFAGFISNFIPVPTANAIVSYNILPQLVKAADIPATFPNLQYPSIFNPAPSVSALLRLTTFPSTANPSTNPAFPIAGWVNNIPLPQGGINITASNGVIHHSAFLVTPPSKYLWNRIDTDPELTYLKAAIIRADSGTAAPGFLQGALLNIGANLTLFAPTDVAFQTILTGKIYQVILPLYVQQLTAAYINAGMTPTDAAALAAVNAPPLALAQATSIASTPDVFSNPQLYGVLTAQTVKGILVYHLFGKRAFTNNFPTTGTLIPTLLNGAIPSHPGVTLTGTFGVPFVTSATIKGAYNTTASNVIINASPLTPDPSGTSDQHYLNGVMHKIDQVLIPLPL